jgi:hypothetical protein
VKGNDRMPTTIASLTEAERALIPEYKEKWVRSVKSREPIHVVATQRAIAQLYAELQVGAPRRFLYAASPIEALQGYFDWRSEAGRLMVTLWDYQSPLCDP